MKLTKRQTWLFFVISSMLSLAVFVVLTIDTHRQVRSLTNADQLTPAVKSGNAVWHKYNCTNCHTLLGEGAYFAPDLTKITQLRGEQYLVAFMKNPINFYSWDQYGRVMPTLNMTDEEINDVIAFLAWVSNINTQGWPPRPLLVSGSAIPGAAMAEPKEPASATPVAQGEALFKKPEIGCASCHSLSADVKIVGPTVAGLKDRAAKLVQTPGYEGEAADAASYIRESILEPNAHIVPGQNYRAGTNSLMPLDYGSRLSSEQIDQIVEYLMTIE